MYSKQLDTFRSNINMWRKSEQYKKDYAYEVSGDNASVVFRGKFK